MQKKQIPVFITAFICIHIDRLVCERLFIRHTGRPAHPQRSRIRQNGAGSGPQSGCVRRPIARQLPRLDEYRPARENEPISAPFRPL